MHLIRICYLTPLVEKMLPLCLAVYNLWGRFGLAWIRRQIRDVWISSYHVDIFSSFSQLQLQAFEIRIKYFALIM